MMSKFKLITVLVIISILSAGVTAVAEEKTKEFYESWGVTSIQSLDITNKFGEYSHYGNCGLVELDNLINDLER